MTTVGIALFPELEELDAIGPWEVFSMAGQQVEGVRVVGIAERNEPIRCAKGLRLLPDHDFGDAPQLDVLVVPGGQGTRREAENPVFLDWLRAVAPRCQWVTSVCTGSLLLCEAKLAEGRRVTTHWAFVEALRKRCPGSEVLAGARYVRDGQLVTAAGVSAGIDMALWVTGQLWSVEVARRVQRFMEYDPAPPYAADV